LRKEEKEVRRVIFIIVAAAMAVAVSLVFLDSAMAQTVPEIC
jgi:uncharacterized membrane protein YwzB